MKDCVKNYYQHRESQGMTDHSKVGVTLLTLQDLQKTDYFDIVQKRMRERHMEINIGQLVTKMQEFDESDTGLIHAYKIINILKYQLDWLFTDEILIGLQYELECLNHEHLVDYTEFIKIFLQQPSSRKMNTVGEIKLGLSKSAYSLNDYEDLLGRINEHNR
jgi:hypothetical protein